MKKLACLILFLILCLPSYAYRYRNELKGMEKILLVVDLDLDDFPTAPVENLERYTLNILHKNLLENLPAGTTFFRQDYPEDDDVDTMISVDLLIGDDDNGGYYGDVVLEVRRLVFLAEVETVLPFWSVVYNNRYIIRGNIDSIKKQLRSTVEPMVLQLIDDYQEAVTDYEDNPISLESLLMQEDPSLM